MRGSREISLVPSLHRASTEALIHSVYTRYVKAKQRCREGVMSDFVSWCRHLVPFFFMK